jgi:hypothetical protein
MKAMKKLRSSLELGRYFDRNGLSMLGWGTLCLEDSVRRHVCHDGRLDSLSTVDWITLLATSRVAGAWSLFILNLKNS